MKENCSEWHNGDKQTYIIVRKRNGEWPKRAAMLQMGDYMSVNFRNTKWPLVAALVCMTVFLLAGCGDEKKSSRRGADLDYTVVPTADCPADFLAEINKKKINSFQMTYEDGVYCYLAVGYGEQETNGFSIKVLGLYEQGDRICLETSLVGPEEDQVVSKKKSTPYLVVKTKKTDREVDFSV